MANKKYIVIKAEDDAPEGTARVMRRGGELRAYSKPGFFSRIKKSVADKGGTALANMGIGAPRYNSDVNRAKYWGKAADALKADREYKKGEKEAGVVDAGMDDKNDPISQTKIFAARSRKQLATGKDELGRNIYTKRYRRADVPKY